MTGHGALRDIPDLAGGAAGSISGTIPFVADA